MRILWILLGAVMFGGTVRAAVLDVIYDNVFFGSREAAQSKATWTGPADRPLDFTDAGLGCEAVGSDNAWVEAAVTTEPLALGSYGQPWYNVGLTVDITGFVDPSGFPFVTRVYVRHSPDRKHWTTWQALGWKSPEALRAEHAALAKHFSKTASGKFEKTSVAEPDWSKRIQFSGVLSVPRTTRQGFENLLADFAKTNPPRPKFQEDAVRWILAKDSRYFEKDPPFVGYVQFLIEANVGQGPRRLKGLMVVADTMCDELMGHLTDKNRVEYEGKRWAFVAP